MKQTDQIQQHLLKLLETDPDLTVRLNFSPDGAFFLWTQLLLLRHHHANQSEDPQQAITEIINTLEKELKFLSPVLSKIIKGLQWENLLGACYSDLSPDVSAACYSSDAQVSETPDQHVLRKAECLGSWIVGYYYYRSANELNFHLVGNYQEDRTAKCALSLLRNCYPLMSWRLLFVSDV
ncbi:hypothetical protein [Coleofasciculus sp. F4-SAH-05]|uniref:hypothetical protein n=1 Tax=Coleofasciculus sp. F4-SAH-05 TaxID=3069525 RepID=UPI0032F681F9